jgi:hypothetical protein
MKFADDFQPGDVFYTEDELCLVVDTQIPSGDKDYFIKLWVVSSIGNCLTVEYDIATLVEVRSQEEFLNAENS